MRTFAQTDSGTIVVAGHHNGTTVIAADSRVFHTNAGTYEDNQCKLVALNDKVLFAAVGLSAIRIGGSQTNGLFFSTEDAKRSLDLVMSDNDHPSRLDLDIASRIADAWGNRVSATMVSLFFGDHVSEIQPEGIFIVATNEGPLLSFATVSRGPRDGEWTWEVSTSPAPNETRFIPFGHPQTVLELLQGTTDRSRSELSRLAEETKGKSRQERDRMTVQRYVELTIAWNLELHDIGGPTDIAEVDKTGIHWIQRKPNCPEIYQGR